MVQEKQQSIIKINLRIPQSVKYCNKCTSLSLPTNINGVSVWNSVASLLLVEFKKKHHLPQKYTPKQPT